MRNREIEDLTRDNESTPRNARSARQATSAIAILFEQSQGTGGSRDRYELKDAKDTSGSVGVGGKRNWKSRRGLNCVYGLDPASAPALSHGMGTYSIIFGVRARPARIPELLASEKREVWGRSLIHLAEMLTVLAARTPW